MLRQHGDHCLFLTVLSHSPGLSSGVKVFESDSHFTEFLGLCIDRLQITSHRSPGIAEVASISFNLFMLIRAKPAKRLSALYVTDRTSAVFER